MAAMAVVSLGFGTLGMMVGGVWGLLAGAIGGAITAAMLGWDKTVELTTGLLEGWNNGTFTPWA